MGVILSGPTEGLLRDVASPVVTLAIPGVFAMWAVGPYTVVGELAILTVVNFFAYLGLGFAALFIWKMAIHPIWIWVQNDAGWKRRG
jgi:hypothetical protein